MEDFNSQYANHSKLEQLKQFILEHGTYIELKKGEYHDYHIYLNATRYTVEPGHSLALVITTEDPINCLIHKTYSVEIENASVTAEVPMTEAVENRVMTRK